ncbi:DUF6387 family protein [Serratia oryzae]|uniref:DUF6387 family protein n=1 Tax=Serratia oryzae TaxID=2034155 RepID=UPI0012E11636|nr:DUF6387 family protein [Serratia oryzae]
MRISKKSDLPKWFNLENYKKFSDLDDDMFITQIIVRRNDEVTDVYKSDRYFEDKLSSGIYPLNYPECKHEFISDAKRLSSSRIFSPISLLSLGDINDGVENINESNDKNIYDSVDLISPYPFFYGDIHCAIRLDAQDDLIINDLKKLLPEWRRQLGIELESEKIKNSWDIVRGKIISYQAMALRDLLMWQKASGNQITNGVLTVALYPEGDFDATNIVQTIKPFVENLFTDSSIEKFDAEISSKRK